MDNINKELGRWLLDQKDNLNEIISQRDLFEIVICEENDTETQQHQIKLIKKLAEEFTKLSYIINATPTKIEQLADFLIPDE